MYNAFVGFEHSRNFMCMSVHEVLAPLYENEQLLYCSNLYSPLSCLSYTHISMFVYTYIQISHLFTFRRFRQDATSSSTMRNSS